MAGETLAGLFADVKDGGVGDSFGLSGGDDSSGQRVFGELFEAGRVRLTRGTQEVRLDKPARSVKVGDSLVFALGGRLVAVVVTALGDRRGPADEARNLYSDLEKSSQTPGAAEH